MGHRLATLTAPAMVPVHAERNEVFSVYKCTKQGQPDWRRAGNAAGNERDAEGYGGDDGESSRVIRRHAVEHRFDQPGEGCRRTKLDHYAKKRKSHPLTQDHSQHVHTFGANRNFSQ